MKNVKSKIWELLKSDTVIKSYTGGDEKDPRVYLGWPSKKIGFSDQYHAYIIFYETGCESVLNRDNEIYTIQIFSKSMELNENIFSRIDSIFRGKVININSYTNLSILRENKIDFGDEEDDIKRKVVNYRFAII